MRTDSSLCVFCFVAVAIILAAASTARAENWDFDFTVATEDTEWPLIAGVRPLATATYNILWDLPYLGTPLDSAAMWKSFEPLTGLPIWLTSDRKNDDGVFWQWDLTVGLLLSLAEKTVSWDSSTLPTGEWFIGKDLPSPEWVSMDTASSFTFSITEGVRIRRYLRPIVDVSGPVMQLITPSEGDTGVPINIGLVIEVTDSQSWVDDTTIDVQIFDRIPVVVCYPLELGYRVYVELATDLPSDSLIPVIVRAGNVADAIAYTTDTLYFTTSNETAIYSLGGDISLSDGGDPSGATIELYSGDSLVGADTVASDGGYFIDNLNSGIYLALVEKADYHDGGGYVMIYVEGWTRDFVLEPDSGAAIDEPDAAMPKEISISAYPNPFNGNCRLMIDDLGLGIDAIEIFDVNGRMVDVISSEGFQPDEKSPTYPQEISPFGRNDRRSVIVWQPADNIGSGVYLVRATMQGNKGFQPLVQTKRIVYLK